MARLFSKVVFICCNISAGLNGVSIGLGAGTHGHLRVHVVLVLMVTVVPQVRPVVVVAGFDDEEVVGDG